MIRTVFKAGVWGCGGGSVSVAEWKIGEEEKHRFGGHLQVRRGGGSRPQNGGSSRHCKGRWIPKRYRTW